MEQNRDAQLRGLLAAELGIPLERLASLRFYGGQPLSAGPVVEAVLDALGRTPSDSADPSRPLQAAGGE